MGKNRNIRAIDISEKLAAAFLKVRKQLIEEEKKRNGYLIISDNKGNALKIPAKHL